MDKPFLIPINNYIDERGQVYGITQFIDDTFKDKVKDTRDLYKRVYTVSNFQTKQIRAFHGHKISSTILHVIKGAAKIVTMPIGLENSLAHTRINSLEVFTLSDKKPGLVYVPAGWYNGHISLEPNTIYVVLSSASIYDVKDDDIRLSYDALGTIPWEISCK